jgi:repressor LexA
MRAIKRCTQRDGYAPTMREIGKETGLASTSSVRHQLSRLEEKGYLSRGARLPRTAVVQPLTDPADPGDPPAHQQADHVHSDIGGQRFARVPLVGRIAAGEQILADQLIDDIFPLPTQLVGEGDLIMLRVVGDSMINAAIADGDLVVVRRGSDVENGEIVAATLEGIEVEGTVKTLKRSDGHVWLMPQNPAYSPILGDDAKIVGKVVAVLRRVR